MKYAIKYLDTAEEGLLKLRKSGDKQALKKLEALIEELKVHPTQARTPQALARQLPYVPNRKTTMNK